MFNFDELLLLRLALDAYNPKPANAAAARQLLEKVRALAANDGLLPVCTATPPGEAPDLATIGTETVKLVYLPIYRGLLNAFRSLGPTWTDATAGLGTVFSVVVSIAKDEKLLVDPDRLVRFALRALADLPGTSQLTRRALERAQTIAQPPAPERERGQA